MEWLKHSLLRNWELKVLALVLAGGLWAIVTQGPPVEIGLQVPLELRHVPLHLQVSGELPAAVHLRLRGPENRLRELEPGAVAVVVDLAGALPGNHIIELRSQHVRVPPGVEVVSLSPTQVRLELVPR